MADAKPSDMVNHPRHYTSGENGIECIDAIQAALGRDGFISFLRGQIIKYTWRGDKKGNAAEDIAKANWYGAKLESVLKEPPTLAKGGIVSKQTIALIDGK